MKDNELIIFTLIGLIFCAPFIFTILFNSFFGYEQDKTWSLIVLGMATSSLPIAVLGVWKIINRLPELETKP